MDMDHGEGSLEAWMREKGGGEGQMAAKQAAFAVQVAKAWQESSASWSEFTQHTTFHGIKYIFDDQNKHQWRRVVWVVCVLGALALFLVNVGQRVDAYFQYKTNVDVQIIYTNTSTLPAVTICNQNNFRITEANKRGLYYFIDEFYSADNIKAVNMEKYDLEATNSENFILQTAHQLDDLVDSCTWRGKACDLTSDFVTTLTDLGVCYTFNSGQDGQVRKVTDSGSSFALSLVLNVEQYEYMRGPQNDAGVKILLHDQGDSPMVKDLGFAAAPGTHTLVGVHRAQISSLPAPYGTCAPGSNQSLSECLLRCRTNEIVHRCGCRDIYMPQLPNDMTPVCNMTDLFVCVTRELAVLRREQVTCACAVPCKRVQYEPNLSFAQLSRFNIDRLVLNEPIKRAQVQQQFIYAQEVNQRVDVAAIQYDNTSINNILNHSTKLGDDLSQLSVMLGEDGLLNEVNQLSTAMIKDHKMIRDWLLSTLTSLAVVTRNVLEMEDFFSTIAPYLELNYSPNGIELWRFGIKDMLEFCDNNITYPINISDYNLDAGSPHPPSTRAKRGALLEPDKTVSLNEEYDKNLDDSIGVTDSLPLDDFMEWMFNEDDDSDENNGALKTFFLQKSSNMECEGFLVYQFKMSRELLSKCFKTASVVHGILTDYLQKVDAIFTDASINPDQVPEHIICKNLLAKFDNFSQAFITSLEEALTLWTEAKTMDDLLYASELVLMLVNSTETAQSLYIYKEIRSGVCFWIQQSLSIDDIKRFDNDYNNALQNVKGVMPWMNTIEVKVSETINLLNTSIQPLLQKTLVSYISRHTLKQEMSQTMTASSLYDSTEKLRKYSESISSKATTVLDTLATTTVSYPFIYDWLFSLQVPILNGDRIFSLELTKVGQDMNNAEIDHLLNTLATDLQGNYLKIISKILDNIVNQFKEHVDMFVLEDQLLRKGIDDYKKHLSNFLEKLEMDESFFMENFLQVDIFYKELKYELIEQHEAFELLSLFGEVGGFLGLLLGASVLTVCELVDYIILLIINRYDKRKK